MNRNKPTNRNSDYVTGIGQLSLVEHALCPLDSKASLSQNLAFSAAYSYTNRIGKRREARARVFSPLGLSASDELYLWGLLALTLLPKDPISELTATPHWVLRQLGIINQKKRRGGRQYDDFRESIRRLSAVTYMNDAFYDPLREEHRQISFSFFSYSLPKNADSSRAWRISWDPIFFEMVNAAAGQFRFDLSLYRELDSASRRLFLFANKVLSRRREIRAVGLEHLAHDLLGFSDTLPTRVAKSKVSKCLLRLRELHVLDDSPITKTAPGRYFVRLRRGRYFENRMNKSYSQSAEQSPFFENLLTIGFDQKAATRLIKRFPPRLLAQWIDITQAAIETRGMGFFKVSPMAFLVDSINKAAQGVRSAPDWWVAQKKAEASKLDLSSESQQVFSRLRSEIFSNSIGEVAESESTGPTRIRDVLAG